LEHGLVPAGVAAVIFVRAESSRPLGLNQGVAESELVAKVEGRVVGRARTGSDGWAALPLGVLDEGVHSVQVTGPGSTRSFTVLARARGTPIIVCDIDGTIYRRIGASPSSDPGGEAAYAFPGAAEALRSASKRFGIVYVTAREEAYRTETRRFIESARFPGGCLVMWNASTDPVSRRSLKTKHLLALRSDWPWLRWGIGDLESDVDAYRGVGVEAVRLEPDLDQPQKKARGGTWLARDWTAVKKILAGDRTP